MISRSENEITENKNEKTWTGEYSIGSPEPIVHVARKEADFQAESQQAQSEKNERSATTCWSSFQGPRLSV